MDQKRINLCFDVDDEQQKEVYEYLTRSGRRKTAVVVAALSQTMMSDAYWRNMQIDRDAELCERFAKVVRENNASMDVSQVLDAIRQLNEKIENLKVVAANTETAGASQDGPAQEAPAQKPKEPEMNEDAFASVMSLLG